MQIRGRREGEDASVTAALSSPEVVARVRRLELRTSGFVTSLFTGEHRSIFHGRGMEFSHVRGYQPGDDVRMIDWRVTARRGVPYVRQFVEERDLLVLLLVDVSASGRMGPGAASPSEVAHLIAGALTFAAVRNNDRVGIVLVTDRVEYAPTPASGRGHAVRMLGELVSRSPAGRRTDLVPGLERMERLGGRGLIFVISDFMQDHTAPRFRDSLARIARTHELVALRLSSAATAELPDVGWVELTDPETLRRVVVDTGSRSVRRRFRDSVGRNRAELAGLLGEVGASIVEIDTDADPLEPLAGFLRQRRRMRG